MASEFSYKHLDIGYINGDAELGDFLGNANLDVEGFFVSGRYEIANNFFAYAQYENGEIRADSIRQSADIWSLEGGIGGYLPLADTVDLYYGFGYKYTDLDDGTIEQTLGNINLHAGLRWAPAPWVEVNPYLETSIGVHDDDTLEAADASSAGLNLYLTAFDYVHPFVGISWEFDNSSDSVVNDQLLYSVGLRISF